MTPRALALAILQKVLRKGRPLDEERERWLIGLDPRDRAFVHNLVATSLRKLGGIETILKECLDRPLKGESLTAQDILILGTAQILFTRVAVHAAVNETVDLAPKPFKGLVNAVLRKIIREQERFLTIANDPKFAFPSWLWQNWKEIYGEETARLMVDASLKEAPLDITVKNNPEEWAEKLNAIILPSGSLRINQPEGAIENLPGYTEGQWWIQDASGALAVGLLGDIKDKKALDMCAAPGGKTAQLLANGAIVTAIDRAENRIRRFNSNMERLSYQPETIICDAEEFTSAEKFNIILLDAPCSSTGTIRRHPDIIWHKNANDVSKLVNLQKNLLNKAISLLNPGGILLYCVCSLQKEEGEEQIRQFLTANSQIERIAIGSSEIFCPQAINAEGDLRILPHYIENGWDGFFMARLRKKA